MGQLGRVTFAFVAMGTAVSAQQLDQAVVGVTGFVSDVCSVEALTDVSATGVVADLGGIATGAGVKTAAIAFDYDIANDANASAANVGVVSDGSIDVDIDLYCNGPFQFTIAATNGAMVNDDLLANTADFTNSLPYSVSFSFPDGTVAPVTPASGAGGVIVSDPSVPPQSGAGTLRIAFSSPDDGRKPISGLYSDALTISFVQDGTTPSSTFP